jgi:hypothetical protein
MGAKIGFIVIIIFALGLGLYLYSSGALVRAAGAFNALFPVPSSSGLFGGSPSASSGTPFWDFLGVGNGDTVSIPTIGDSGQVSAGTPPSSGSGGSSGSGESGTGSTAPPPINPADIPPGFTAAQLSPYFNQVRLTGVAPGSAYYYGTITVSNEDYNSTGTIDVSGWQIKSRNSGEYIPQAINIYDPTGLTAASDIRLRPGDTLYLYSSSAPFNLRLNECTGYIASVANFQPALPLSCPPVNQSQIQNFTGQCQNYINSIGGCQQPNMSSPQIPQTDYACQNFLENNFTYKSCFTQHYSDPNFLSNQIWAWTGSNVVDPYHDSVQLLDNNGLLVDLYTY